MTLLFPILAVVFAAFCVWLTVRVVTLNSPKSERKPRWSRRTIARAAAAVAIVWFLLGGLSVRIEESFDGAQTLQIGKWNHTVFVESERMPVQPKFLRITWDYIGEPYSLAFHVVSNGDHKAHAVIDKVFVVTPGGERRPVVTKPVEISYGPVGIFNGGSGVLYNFGKLPISFQESEDYNIELVGMLFGEDVEPKEINVVQRRNASLS